MKANEIKPHQRSWASPSSSPSSSSSEEDVELISMSQSDDEDDDDEDDHSSSLSVAGSRLGSRIRHSVVATLGFNWKLTFRVRAEGASE